MIAWVKVEVQGCDCVGTVGSVCVMVKVGVCGCDCMGESGSVRV